MEKLKTKGKTKMNLKKLLSSEKNVEMELFIDESSICQDKREPSKYYAFGYSLDGDHVLVWQLSRKDIGYKGYQKGLWEIRAEWHGQDNTETYRVGIDELEPAQQVIIRDVKNVKIEIRLEEGYCANIRELHRIISKEFPNLDLEIEADTNYTEPPLVKVTPAEESVEERICLLINFYKSRPAI